MSRPPILRASFLRPGEIMVDNFAGGGGATSGIEAAMGAPVDLAFNHSREAIAMHEANHPETRHFCEDILTVDPREVCGSRPVGLAWFSPACTDFSRAKGGPNPKSATIRGLSWIVVRWIDAVRPRLVLLENVEEIEDWGRLGKDGQPDPAYKGETFRQWVGAIKDRGYSVDWRSLVAADYGTPTIRRRLFLVARCDGAPIVWPEETHGEGRPERWRPASDIIDWTLPCPSIFDRPRPLAEATLRRIGAGLRRYVVESPNPFLVKYHGGVRGATRGQPLDEPLRTMDTANRFSLVTPFVSPVKSWGGGGNGARSVELPMRTTTASKRGEHAVVAPFLAPLTHQGSDRTNSIEEPLRTVTCANRGEFALIDAKMERYAEERVAPFVIRHGHYSTITGAGLIEGCGAGTFRGQPLASPLGTVCATNDKHLVAPIMAPVLLKHYRGVVGHGVDRTLGTVTAKDHHSLAACWLEKFYGSARAGADVQLPLPTVTANGRGGGHLAEVRAFLVKYYGTANGQALTDPLHTVTALARFGLVMVYGEPYQIVDIGMRMLQPRELFNAMGFHPGYIIDPTFNGKPLTKTAATSLAGNAVCCQVAQKLVEANMRSAA